MSYAKAPAPECLHPGGGMALIIRSRTKMLGGLPVRRVLPAPERRAVGPFVFFDHMGPVVFPPGEGIDVRPHPHIGLATITYLFAGEILHRDSLGVVQPITPGAVNLMTAGRGIAHSERSGSDRGRSADLHGIQAWIALPDGAEDIAPSFCHTPAEALPRIEVGEARMTVIVGEAFGAVSPVARYSPTSYLEVLLPEGAGVDLPFKDPENAVYVVSGAVFIHGAAVEAGEMAVLHAQQAVTVEARSETRLMLIGGASVGRRHIWWNFVSSGTGRIESAKRAWRKGDFPTIPGDEERTPLPEDS